MQLVVEAVVVIDFLQQHQDQTHLLNAPAGITAAVQGFPITVGAGGSFPGNGSPSFFQQLHRLVVE